MNGWEWLIVIAVVALLTWFIVLPWWRKRKADKLAGKP